MNHSLREFLQKAMFPAGIASRLQNHLTEDTKEAEIEEINKILAPRGMKLSRKEGENDDNLSGFWFELFERDEESDSDWLEEPTESFFIPFLFQGDAGECPPYERSRV